MQGKDLTCFSKGWSPNDRYDRYDQLKKGSAIVAIIWKPLFSERSNRGDRCDNDRYDRPQFYLNDRSDRCDHMENHCSRDCSDRCDRCDEKYTRMQYVAVCSRSLGHFLNSVAIVAIIWKLAVVRIAQLFCDRSDHMETSLKRILVLKVMKR